MIPGDPRYSRTDHGLKTVSAGGIGEPKCKMRASWLARIFFTRALLLWCRICALGCGIRRLWTHSVRCSLDESLDLDDVGIGQLAGEVRHALVNVGTLEDHVFQVGDVLRRRITEVLDVAALVDAGHPVTGGAGLDIQRGAVRNVIGIVFDAREQIAELIFGEFRQRRLSTNGKGVDRAWSFLVGDVLRDAEHASPADRNRYILHAVDQIGRGRGNRAGAGWRLPEFFACRGVIGDEARVGRALEHEVDCGRQSAAIPCGYLCRVPGLLLLYWIPRNQPSEGRILRRDGVQREADVPSRGGAELEGGGRILRQRLLAGEVQRYALRRQIDEAGLGIVGHWVPIMRAERARNAVEGLVR